MCLDYDVQKSFQELPEVVITLSNIMQLYNSVATAEYKPPNPLLSFRCEYWRGKLWHHRLATLYLIHQMVTCVLAHCIETNTHQATLIRLYNFLTDYNL